MTHWAEKLFHSAKCASKQRATRGRDCSVTITQAQIESLWGQQRGRCYFSGMPLSKDRDQLDTVSIDRLDPDSGYSFGNVVLSTKAMNFARSGHAPEEFERFLRRLVDSWVAKRYDETIAAE